MPQRGTSAAPSAQCVQLGHIPGRRHPGSGGIQAEHLSGRQLFLGLGTFLLIRVPWSIERSLFSIFAHLSLKNEGFTALQFF